jgi:hypothetical protein
VVLGLPEDIHDVGTPVTQELSDSLIERRVFDAGERGLAADPIVTRSGAREIAIRASAPARNQSP